MKHHSHALNLIIILSVWAVVVLPLVALKECYHG